MFFQRPLCFTVMRLNILIARSNEDLSIVLHNQSLGPQNLRFSSLDLGVTFDIVKCFQGRFLYIFVPKELRGENIILNFCTRLCVCNLVRCFWLVNTEYLLQK